MLGHAYGCACGSCGSCGSLGDGFVTYGEDPVPTGTNKADTWVALIQGATAVGSTAIQSGAFQKRQQQTVTRPSRVGQQPQYAPVYQPPAAPVQSAGVPGWVIGVGLAAATLAVGGTLVALSRRR